MKGFQRRVAGRVFGIHIGVVLMLLSVSGLKGCFQRKSKPEIVTFIDFGQPAPTVNVQEVAEQPDPEPAKPAPQPEPEPPPPERVPEKPAEIKPPTKVVPPKVVKPKPPKKTWKPTKASDIKMGEKVEPSKPPKPRVSEQEIRKALSGVQQPTKRTTGPVGNPNEIAAYDAVIYKAFYNRWTRDNLAASSRPAKVTISIDASGQVLSSRLSQKSGDAQVDTSVMAAVHAVRRLPKAPPKGYERNNIVIVFTVTN